MLAVDKESQSVLIKAESLYTLPGLPPGYYFKGGAAREQLRILLNGKEQKVQVRDYDLVRYMHVSDEHDHELSERFMGDDYEFGRGVEVVENKRIYFKTRDITQNEVLAAGGSIEASFAALLDMEASILRPTSFVTNRAGEVLSATIAKMYRFKAEAQIEGRPATILDLPEDARLSYFSAALNLDRSFAHSEAVALEYVQLLWEHTEVFADFEVPPPLPAAVDRLAAEIKQGVALFRNLPTGVLAEL